MYGPKWRTPHISNHGFWPNTPDGKTVVKMLLEKLSVGAWGSMPLVQRLDRCTAALQNFWRA